jgi:prevent-host-death family protein
MSTIPFSEARAQLTDVVNRVSYKNERFILTRKGKQIAAIVSLNDLKAIEASYQKTTGPSKTGTCKTGTCKKRRIDLL